MQEHEHVDFVGAVEMLAAKAGIQLTYTTTGQSKERAQRKRLVDAMGTAVEWYHQRLLDAPDARAARDYLRSRGLAGDVAREFKIGWAPDDWDALAKGAGIAPELLRTTGLAFVNRRERMQDALRGRVLFPIFSENGEPVAIGGRVLPGSTDPAKYKNSPETPIYAKSKTLYGLNWAKADIVVGGGHEPRLVRRRRQVDARVEHGVEEGGVRRGVGARGAVEVADGAVGEEDREHRPGALHDVLDAGHRERVGRRGLDRVADPGEVRVDVVGGVPQGGEAGGRRDRVPGQRARLVDGALGRQPRHHVRPPAERRRREAAAHDLAEGHQVRHPALGRAVEAPLALRGRRGSRSSPRR